MLKKDFLNEFEKKIEQYQCFERESYGDIKRILDEIFWSMYEEDSLIISTQKNDIITIHPKKDPTHIYATIDLSKFPDNEEIKKEINFHTKWYLDSINYTIYNFMKKII